MFYIVHISSDKSVCRCLLRLSTILIPFSKKLFVFFFIFSLLFRHFCYVFKRRRKKWNKIQRENVITWNSVYLHVFKRFEQNTTKAIRIVMWCFHSSFLACFCLFKLAIVTIWFVCHSKKKLETMFEPKSWIWNKKTEKNKIKK